MWDDILEFVIEFILEGLFELFPMIPKPIRIFLICTILIALFGGSGLLIGFGIFNKTAWMLGLGIAVLIGTIIWFVYLAYRYLQEKHLLDQS